MRLDKPKASDMDLAQTTGWAPECHFLLVTIHGKKMTLEPISAFEGGNTRSVHAIDPWRRCRNADRGELA